MKYIFTICTNIYTEYFENFKNSINNFYPHDDKILIVFSNKLQEYNNYQIDKTLIKIINIPNLLYTSILLNKFNFIIWYCENNNINENEIVYFFDIDTYFYDNENAYQYLDNDIKENINSVIFTHHPLYIYNHYTNSAIYVHGFIENYFDKNYKYSKAFNEDYSFSNYNLWCKDCITSFFTGTLKAIINLNNIYTKYYIKDLSENRVIPTYCDEDIINYILLKQLIEEINEQYIYITNNIINLNIESINIYNKFCYFDTNFEIPEDMSKYLICNQKYNSDKKNINRII